MNTITIELCKEDRDRLDGLLRVLCGIADTMEAPSKPQEAATPVPAPEVTTNTPEPAKPEPEPAAAPSVSKRELQRRVLDLVTAGKKAEVRAVITQYAEKVSDVPADKIQEVWEQLNALEG